LIITSTGSAIGTKIISKFDSAATSNAASGLKIGDEIVKINGSRVHVNNDIMYDLVLDKDGDVSMQVKRDGNLVDLPKVSFPMTDDGNGGKVMRVDFWVQPQAKTVISVLHEAFYQTISMVRLVWLTFFSLFNGRFGLSDLAGPIGTTAAVGQAASQGISTLLFVTAMIAVNLGVVNLFPLPALDGGMFFMLIIEAIRKKPVKAKYQGFVNFVGFALLMVLMVVVSFNDILRLIKG
jgi:regulator of sigma E protease